MRKSIFCFLIAAFVFSSSYAARPFLIDTDMGVDDVIALLYLLKRQDIDIKAITITANASVDCEPGLKNLYGLLKLMNKTNIPVACGPSKPLAGNHHYPVSVVEESNTLAGTAAFLPVTTAITSGNALDLLVDTLQHSSQPVTVLALGPLTNLALALQKKPNIKKKIRQIYMMGGAINVPGNVMAVDKTIKNTAAEWNLYIDPLAADYVFKQAIPLVLVPLDATNRLPIDKAFYERIKRDNSTPEANYIFILLNKNMKILNANEWYFWDPLAAVIATDESIAHFKTYSLKVQLAPESYSGATRIQAQGGNLVRVVTKADANKFKAILLHYLH